MVSPQSIIILLQLLMSQEFSELLQNEHGPTNSTQLKIMKLLEQLKQPTHRAETKNLDKEEVKKFKDLMISKFQILDERINTVNTILNQVEKQVFQLRDEKNIMRMSIQHQENVEEIQNDAKQYFNANSKQLQQAEKKLSNKILQMKMYNIQQQEKAKCSISLLEDEMKNHLNRLSRIKNQKEIDLAQVQLQQANKIRKFKAAIEEQGVKNREQKKKLKNIFLQVCQKFQLDLEKQQQLLEEGFDVNSQTLQKLVKAISSMIKS